VRVIHKKGAMVTVCQNGKFITRNTSHFKIVSSMFPETEHDDVDTQSDDDISEAREKYCRVRHNS